MLYRNASLDENISLHDYYTTDGNAYNAELGFEHDQSRDVNYRVYFMGWSHEWNGAKVNYSMDKTRNKL